MALPVLFFSDLISGPKSGWEGSATKGAAVSIWGLNLGSSQGSSTINCCGQTLSAGVNVPEWGASGTALGIPRGLQRITFYLNSSMTDGAGTISVTVSGVTSNALSFTIRAGNIYFISVTDGNNSFNGQRSTNQGSPNGPWKDALKISPSNNSVLRPGDCIYIRGGAYSQMDDQQMFVHIRSSTYSKGTATQPYSIAAHPTEIPIFNCAPATRGFNYPEGTYADYYTFSKLKFINGYTAFGGNGLGNRMLGNWFQDMTLNAWSGVIWVSDSQNTYIYGNYWDNCGHDKYKHNIYAKTQPGANGTGATLPMQNLFIGWNEFSRPQSSDGYGGTVFLSKSSDSGSIGDTLNTHIFSNYFHDGNCGDFIYTGDGTSNVGETYIYNNLFVGGTVTSHGCIFWAAGSGNGYVYNNTFYLVSPGLPTVFYSGSGGGTVAFKNNIFYNAVGQSFFATESGNTHAVTSDHDHYYQSGTTTLPSAANLTVTSATTGNPLFSTAGSDFHLQTTSPCKDTGVSVASVVTRDYEGVSRPQNSVFDKGAYEFAAGSGGAPPAAPTGLHII